MGTNLAVIRIYDLLIYATTQSITLIAPLKYAIKNRRERPKESALILNIAR